MPVVKIDNPDISTASTSTLTHQSTSESQITDNNYRQPSKRRRTIEKTMTLVILKKRNVYISH